MKLLRNPFVTGALVVIAIVLATYQVLQSRRSLPVNAAAPPTASAVAERLKTPTPQTQSGEAGSRLSLTNNARFLPVQPIDSNFAAAHIAEWADEPMRDPFLLAPYVADQPVPEPVHVYHPSPVTRWKLKGIWRQTGGRVAAINNGIYMEGDSIEGFRIEKIEGDGVWFAGPDHMEHLGFEAPTTKKAPVAAGSQTNQARQ